MTSAAIDLWAGSLEPHTAAHLHRLAAERGPGGYLAGIVKAEYAELVAVGRPFYWPMSVVKREPAEFFEHVTPNRPDYAIFRSVAATLDDAGAVRFIAVSWTAVDPAIIEPHMLAPHHVETSYLATGAVARSPGRRTIPASDVGVSLAISDEAIQEGRRIADENAKSAIEARDMVWR